MLSTHRHNKHTHTHKHTLCVFMLLSVITRSLTAFSTSHFGVDIVFVRAKRRHTRPIILLLTRRWKSFQRSLSPSRLHVTADYSSPSVFPLPSHLLCSLALLHLHPSDLSLTDSCCYSSLRWQQLWKCTKINNEIMVKFCTFHSCDISWLIDSYKTCLWYI